MAERARSMGGGDTDVGLVQAPLGAAKNNLVRADGRMHSGAVVGRAIRRELVRKPLAKRS